MASIKDLNLAINASNIINTLSSNNDFAIIIALDIWKNHNRSVNRTKQEARIINTRIRELIGVLNGEKLSGSRWLLLYELYIHKFVPESLLNCENICALVKSVTRRGEISFIIFNF